MELEKALRALDVAVRDMLAEDLPRHLRSLKNLLAMHDLAGACQEAHSVRGSAAFCRLAALREAAEALETSLVNDQKNADLRAFENNIERVLHALENIEHTG